LATLSAKEPGRRFGNWSTVHVLLCIALFLHKSLKDLQNSNNKRLRKLTPKPRNLHLSAAFSGA